MDVLTLSVAVSALPEAMDHGTRVGELGGGAVPPVGRRRHSRESRLRAPKLVEHAATLPLLGSELADAVACSDLHKHDKHSKLSAQN